MPKTASKRLNLTDPTLFFVTTTFYKWRSLLSESAKRDAFEALLFSLFPSHAEALMGYVIMPEHIHLLVGCRKGGGQLSRFVQTLKSLSARRLFPGQGSVWMEGFDDLAIRGDKQFRIKLDYIHQNPVKRGFVAKPEEWRWSSAGFWVEDDTHPVLTKGWEWMEG